jgi:hypothetical protein
MLGKGRRARVRKGGKHEEMRLGGEVEEDARAPLGAAEHRVEDSEESKKIPPYRERERGAAGAAC